MYHSVMCVLSFLQTFDMVCTDSSMGQAKLGEATVHSQSQALQPHMAKPCGGHRPNAVPLNIDKLTTAFVEW
jgi:hypothetical protein